MITYYTLRAWDLRDHIAIERPLAEFANCEIRHHVEFSLHPIAWKEVVPIEQVKRPLTAAKIRKACATLGQFGALVATTTNDLLTTQKVRLRNGTMLGIVERSDGTLYTNDYNILLTEIVNGNDPALLAGLILTVGVVSNHGNWFTSERHNKELKVLAQSYDWLLFLTDRGLAQFVSKLLLEPTPELEPARHAFLSSYPGNKGKGNRFTKVRVDMAADKALRAYFTEHEAKVESWFNVISPKKGSIGDLKKAIDQLRKKNWKEILK